MSVKAIYFDSLPVRLAAIAAAGVVVLIAVFAFVWGFANAASSNAELKEVGDLLAALSPSDPQTHFAAASLHERALETGDFEAALREYEIAAALAPHNFLLWLRLAAVRGRAGDTEGAEAALRQAKHLAPHYSRVQWAWGNFLLREGREDEAYAELRKAVAGDETLAPLAAATALQMSDGNAETVSSQFHNSAPVNIALAVQLAGQKRMDDALAIWNRTEATDNVRYHDSERQIRGQLIAQKRFAAAVSMKGFAGSDTDAQVEKITNPGFEQPVKTEGAGEFEWKVVRVGYPQVGVTDSQKLSGSYSMIVLTGGQDPKEFRGPSQLIAVRPGAGYELIVPYRSEVESAATFHWEVSSAKDGRRLAVSPPLDATAEWMTAVVSFVVPADTEGIEIRFVRSECSGAKCSASGNFWFDDLSLKTK